MTTAPRPVQNALEIARAELALRAGCTFKKYFPATGPQRRDLYPRSMLFFAGGKVHRERLFLAANRCSKTVTAAYEVTAHATGAYGDWWPGRRFEAMTDWWVAGDTRETTRDIIQRELFGPRELVRASRFGGMVPAHLALDRTLKTGIADCIDTVWIRYGHDTVHGGPAASTIQFKSYDQGRLAFQGTALSGGIWLDEEPPNATETSSDGGTPSGNGDIYTECLLRTATTNGLVMATLTPLRGLTPFIDECLSRGLMVDASNRVVNAKLAIFGEHKR